MKRGSSIRTTSSEISDVGSHADVNDQESDNESSENESDDIGSDISSESDVKPKIASKKQIKPTPKKTSGTPKRGRKRVLDDSNSEDEVLEKKRVPKVSKEAKESNDSDEDVPLSSLTTSKPTMPSNEELKDRIINLLKTVNLEETSLKLVREKVSIFLIHSVTTFYFRKRVMSRGVN